MHVAAAFVVHTLIYFVRSEGEGEASYSQWSCPRPGGEAAYSQWPCPRLGARAENLQL